MDELKTEEAHLLLDVFQYIKHITNEETEKTRIIEDNKRKYEKNNSNSNSEQGCFLKSTVLFCRDQRSLDDSLSNTSLAISLKKTLR